jgi:hypothetical protein
MSAAARRPMRPRDRIARSCRVSKELRLDLDRHAPDRARSRAPRARRGGADERTRAARGARRAHRRDERREDPIEASSLGLPAPTAGSRSRAKAARAATIERLEGWKRELDAIAQSGGGGLGLVDANNVRLLRAGLDSDLAELVLRRSDRKSYARPALRLVGAIFSQFLHLPVVGRDGATPADLDRGWDDLVSRLEQGPAFIVAGQTLVTEPGRLQASVGALQLAGVADFFGGPLSEAAAAQLAARPATRARFAAARDAVLATIAETRAVLDARAASWPENHVIGKAAYERMLREEQLLPFDRAEIEHMARDELAHGWAEEAWLIALSRKRKLPFGPASGGGLAPGGPALVGYYRDRIAELTTFMTSTTSSPCRRGSARCRSSRRRRSCSRSRRAPRCSRRACSRRRAPATTSSPRRSRSRRRRSGST